MSYLHRKIIFEIFELGDQALMFLSFVVSVWAVGGTISISLKYLLFTQIQVLHIILLLLFSYIFHKIFLFFNLYDSRRLSTKSKEIVDILKAIMLATCLMFIGGYLFGISLITPVFSLIFFSSASLGIIIYRTLGRFILQEIRIKGRNLRNVLIIGTNRRAINFARKLEASPNLGYEILGFIDDDWPGIQEFHQEGFPLLTNIAGLPTFLLNEIIDEVFICLPVKSSYNLISQIVKICKKQGTIVRFLSDILSKEFSNFQIERFGESIIVTLRTGNLMGPPLLRKRVIDFAISFILIIISFPLFSVISGLIKLTSPGRVFFVQERVGLNKRRFKLYKFRTMISEAEEIQSELEHLNEADGPVFKIKGDPRVTVLGKFLRKSSLDELPQLFNVLLGDMSLVGPRPLPLRDYIGLGANWQRRFGVRPGMTCLWQVNGRSDIPFEKWMELDLEYIDNWSMWLDFKILAKTIPAVLKGQGAA